MKVAAVIAIIVAIAAGMYYYSTVLYPNQPEQTTAPAPVNPPVPMKPSLETDGHSITPQGVVETKPSEQDLSLPELFKKVENSVVQITVRAGEQNPLGQGQRLGSGFVYDSNGYVITNNHVVQGATKITVTFLDGAVYRADLVGADPYADLAVIKVDTPKEKLIPLPLGDSSKLEVGDQVAAIGNPFGLSGSMTAGIISQLGRLLQLQEVGGFSIPDVIQTDAAINPGNSGGPLLDLRGEVVGVNSAIRSSTGEFSGIGFAIPSNTVKKIIPALIRDHVYKHPWLGVSGRDVTPEIADALGLKEAKGFLVIDIVANSPAAKFGIKGGDKLVTLDGQQIRLGGDLIVGIDNVDVRKIDDILVYLERNKFVSDQVELTVIRDGKTTKLSVTLGERPNPAESP